MMGIPILSHVLLYTTVLYLSIVLYCVRVWRAHEARASYTHIFVYRSGSGTVCCTCIYQIIENTSCFLVVTGKYVKRTLRENPTQVPFWKSRNQRNSGDQAFDCMEDVPGTCKQMAQKSDAPSLRAPKFRLSPASASPRTFGNRSGSMSWSQGCGHV